MKQENDAPSLYRFAYARLTVLTLIALLFAGLLISVTNDMYAFVKPDRSLSLSLEESVSLSEFSAILSEGGIVQNPTVFRLYVQSKGKTDRLETFRGTLELNASMSYREILQAISEQKIQSSE